MSISLRRSLADYTCRLLQTTLSHSCKSWGLAIRHETAQIPDDSKALLFALDSLLGLAPNALASRLVCFFASLIGRRRAIHGVPSGRNFFDRALGNPRALGVWSMTGAVVLGLLYMAAAGAPIQNLGMNTGALIIGLMMLVLLSRAAKVDRRWATVAMAAMTSALLLTAFFGDKAGGAARWFTFAGLAVQPSLILLPLMIVEFARRRDGLTTLAVIAAAAAMALQPDRAMSAMLATSLIALTVVRPDMRVIAALGASTIGFAATLVRADTLPAAPYVDQILYSAFDLHIAAGAAVLGGAALLLVPAMVGLSRDPANREIYAVFGAAWLAAIMAAALGNYPTPIVGYGGSAIVGYALSLFALPSRAQGRRKAGTPKSAEQGSIPLDHHLLAGLS